MSHEGPQFYDNEAVCQVYLQRLDNPNGTLETPNL